MESWRTVWRVGFAPLMSTDALDALRIGLMTNDEALVQGATTTPPPLMCVQDWPIEAACAIVYAGWKGGEFTTVGDGEEYFAKACYNADLALRQSAACRWFLNWHDDTPRHVMHGELLTEVVRELDRRMHGEASADDGTDAEPHDTIMLDLLQSMRIPHD